MNNSRDTFLELRGKFDGQDPFMTGGHQIIKMRQSDREVPAWATNDKQIQKILLRSFPKLKTDPRQRVGAARWAVVIQLFFRMKMTYAQVAEQTKLSYYTVESLTRNIRRAAAGKRANGSTPTGKPSHRPKR